MRSQCQAVMLPMVQAVMSVSPYGKAVDVFDWFLLRTAVFLSFGCTAANSTRLFFFSCSFLCSFLLPCRTKQQRQQEKKKEKKTNSSVSSCPKFQIPRGQINNNHQRYVLLLLYYMFINVTYMYFVHMYVYVRGTAAVFISYGGGI